MHPLWRIELLGELRAVHGEHVVTRFRSQKTALLLAYLACHLQCPHRRDQLCELLWPEGDPTTASTKFRSTLHWLRQELEPPGIPAGAVLLADRATVQLNPTAVTTDVLEFEAALAAAARAESSDERALHVAQAIELYRGELLPGCSDQWILLEREWLAERFFQALAQHVAHRQEAGDLPGAIAMAHRGVSLDPLREERHAELIRLFAAAGQPAAALRQYSELERLLRQELATEPSGTTRALARQIERQALVPRVERPRTLTSHVTALPEGAPGRSLPRGENRLVTLLDADLSHSLETMRGSHREAGEPRIGHEVDSGGGRAPRAALAHRLLGVMVDTVLKYEGHVDRLHGEGVLAVFGLFQAHEDDAERAIRAGIEIREAARKLGLEVTGGINTGIVYVGIADSEQRQERTVAGPVFDLASRLQAQAQPGQLLVGETTHRQSRGAFEFVPLSLSLQGLPEPVRSYAVTHALPQPRKERGIEGRRCPLIGRERELAQLQEALAVFLHGHGQIVSLIGEAGLGKSRLVAELKAAAPPSRDREGAIGLATLPHGRGSDLLWLEGRCLELSMTTGYSLFLDLLRDYFAWRPAEDAPERVERLLAALQEFVERGHLDAEGAEEIAPLLGHLLSLRSGTDWDLRLKNAAPEQIRHQTLLALQAFFVALARRQPLVLILEDLHWADPLSLDTITLLMEALPQAPLLLVCVYRPEREHRCGQLATLASRKCPEQYTELPLRELTPPQSQGLVAALLGSDPVPSSVTEPILTLAQGNPFFVEEVVHSLLDAGTLYQEDGCWRLREEHDYIAVPGSVQNVILSRVDQLNPETRQVLASASVLGRLFRRRLLEQITAPEGRVERGLWELEERGLIYQERSVPEAEYAFQHVLTQETIYGSLPRQQRMALHQQVGEAMEALYAAGLEEHLEQLAYHYERTAADQKAVEYLLKAGEKTRRTYLNDEAIRYFERALERLDRLASGAGRKEWRLAALQGLGQIHHGTGKVAEAEALYRQAIAFGKEIGLAPRELVRIYGWLADTLFWQRRGREQEPLAEEGLVLLGEDQESPAGALMNTLLWRMESVATYLERLSYCEDLRTVYDNTARYYAFERKDLVEARRWLQALEARAKEHYDLRALGTATCFTGSYVLTPSGDLRGALAQYQQAYEIFSRIADAKHARWCLQFAASEYLNLGEMSAAEEYARRGVEAALGVADELTIAFCSETLGTSLFCQGRLSEAVDAYRRAQQAFQQTGCPAPETRTHLLLGRARLAQGRRREALRHFQEALATADLSSDEAVHVLSALDESFPGSQEFRAFCKRVRTEPREVLESTPMQWWLEAAEAHGFTQLLDRDPFESRLSADWTWEDPFADGAYLLRDGLEIHAANGRDLRRVNLGAPRLLHPAGGEFAAQTVCLPASGTKPAIGGLLLWKDKQNYLRLDRGTRGPHEISFQGCLNDEDVIIGRGHLPAERIILRLERLGTRVQALCSADARNWFTVGHVELAVEDPHPPSAGTRVGLHAIGRIDRTIYPGSYPEGTAIRFTAFEIWTK